MSKWEIVRLGDVCSVVSGTTPKSSVADYWNGNLNWVTPAELNDETTVVYETQRKITLAAVRASSLKPFPAGTVLLSSRAPIGKVAIAGTEMYCNQGFKNLVCSEKIHNGFLYRYLKGKTDYLNSLGRGATFKEISKSIVEDVQIPLPPIEIQYKIASQLNKVSDLISLRKHQVNQLDLMVKSRFVEMFGDPATNPMGWKVKPLSDIITYANNGMARRGNDNDGSIVLRLVELQDGFIDYTAPNRITLSEAETKRYLLKDGDFLFARVNGNPEYVGRCAAFADIGQPVFHNDHIIRVRFDESVLSNRYASELLNGSYGKQEMRDKIKTSAGQYTVSQDGIKKIRVMLPPLPLQNDFANFVCQVDKSKFEIQEGLKKLELQYNALMQKYFG